MPTRTMTMTPMSQGKFIHQPDRRTTGARARAMRADAIREVDQAASAAIHGWLASRVCGKAA